MNLVYDENGQLQAIPEVGEDLSTETEVKQDNQITIEYYENNIQPFLCGTIIIQSILIGIICMRLVLK